MAELTAEQIDQRIRDCALHLLSYRSSASLSDLSTLVCKIAYMEHRRLHSREWEAFKAAEAAYKADPENNPKPSTSDYLTDAPNPYKIPRDKKPRVAEVLEAMTAEGVLERAKGVVKKGVESPWYHITQKGRDEITPKLADKGYSTPDKSVKLTRVDAVLATYLDGTNPEAAAAIREALGITITAGRSAG